MRLGRSFITTHQDFCRQILVSFIDVQQFEIIYPKLKVLTFSLSSFAEEDREDNIVFEDKQVHRINRNMHSHRNESNIHWYMCNEENSYQTVADTE